MQDFTTDSIVRALKIRTL